MLKFNYNGTEITLTEDASADNYRADGRVQYTAMGTDAAGNRYYITWDTTDEWNEAQDEWVATEEDQSYLQDESNACDWDNPVSVELREAAEEDKDELYERYAAAAERSENVEILIRSDDDTSGVQAAGGVVCYFDDANAEYYADTPEKRIELVNALESALDRKSVV